VTLPDVEAAIPLALENEAGGMQQDYEQAVASVRDKTLFKEVLLACALANKDSLGWFSAVSVREPLRLITGRDYDTGAFQSHLAKFCDEERGPVLRKTGQRRNYRWRFVNPQLIPYVRMRGLADNVIGDL
jgi:hypothetical protein